SFSASADSGDCLRSGIACGLDSAWLAGTSWPITVTTTARIAAKREIVIIGSVDRPGSSGRTHRMRVLRHDLRGEQLDRSHGLPVREVAPLEGADEIVGAGGHVLLHVFPHRRRRARQRHTAHPVGMWP